VSRSLCLFACALLALGCGELLDADRYAVTSAHDACGSLAVPADGKCAPVGVSDCGVGFEPDRRGGCVAVNQDRCDDGWFAPPGVPYCTPIDPLACSDDAFATVPDEADTRSLYVDPAAPPGGDGSSSKPLPTIAEALARAPEDARLLLLLSRGEHRGSVDLSKRAAPLRIVGTCSQRTTLVATTHEPALRLGPGTSGTSLEGLAITGGSAGIEASGVSGLKLTGVWVHHIDGPGIVLEGIVLEEGPTRLPDASLKSVLVEHVVDSGISAHGVKLTIVGSQVSQITPRTPGSRALGIDVSASAVFDKDDPSARNVGELSLTRSQIVGTAGAGVRVAEASAHVSDTWIHDVSADALGLSRGIDLRGSPSQTLPASLDVAQSVIEDTLESGIQSTGADLRLSQVTLRHIGASPDADCRGAGVSATFPLHVGASATASVEITSSAVQDVGRVGLELMGGASTVSGVKLDAEASAACAQALGISSGMAAAGGDPSLKLTSTRIDGFATGVEAHGSVVTVDSSVVTCSDAALVSRAADVTGQVICGCQGGVQRCSSQELGWSERCEATDTTTCLPLCIGGVTDNAVVPGASVWLLDQPFVQSRLTDDSGCVELTGVPRGRPLAVAASAPGFGPGLAIAAPIEEPASVPARAALIPVSLASVFNGITNPADPSTDTRLAALIDLRLCGPPTPPCDDKRPSPVCSPLRNVQASLEPQGSTPIYFGRCNNLPDPDLTATDGPDLAFARVAPGPARVVLSSDEGEVRCAPKAWGWPGAKPNEVLVYAEPGYTELGAELDCRIAQSP
jgi:hypothetical protein